MERPYILYVDAYDSFANNIVALLETSLGADVQIVKVDDEHLLHAKSGEELGSFLHQFDAVVVGPGPGSPTNLQDVGWIDRIWSLRVEDVLPVLGICLGFQSLCLAFGAKIEQLAQPRHGLVLNVTHQGNSIFTNVQCFDATMYHSLHVILSDGKPPSTCWAPLAVTPELQPLAWDIQDPTNGIVLMAARHISKPFWGVQFHPESITTGAKLVDGNLVHGSEGSEVLKGWWGEAKLWQQKTPRSRTDRKSFPNNSSNVSAIISSMSSEEVADRHYAEFYSHIKAAYVVQWKSVQSVPITARDVYQKLDIRDGEAILLESALRPDGTPLREDTGRYSIIGLTQGERSFRLHYYLDPSSHVQAELGEHQSSAAVNNFFVYVKKWLQHLHASGGSPNVPFWGGFMGYISYEAGLDTINIPADKRSYRSSPSKRPAVSFALALRSIVIDHLTNQIYIQSTLRDDEAWVHDKVNHLGCVNNSTPQTDRPHISPDKTAILGPIAIHKPDRARYEDKVERCQKAIREGDSYELCLTDQTSIHVSRPSISSDYAWPLYQKMITLNAAPFGVYMKLSYGAQTVTILGSSPERFLSWNRNGRCQYRPIKGTVKKMPGMRLEDAEAILKPSLNAKDVAENLMITDLVRHDLHGVVGAGNVQVTKLFGVEEYQTVFQLVSVIEGQLPVTVKSKDILNSETGVEHPRQTRRRKSYTRSHGMATPDTEEESEHRKTPSLPLPTGIDILAASLPAGSMTGAPKKRSCELLQDIEGGKPRGIYSGVLGYLDVGGGGDFSVVIRTAYRWSDEHDENGNDIWTIGAGGAVTSQSTPQGETEEMITKLDSALRAYEG
ncbi:para-aminobenzoate synthase [Tothia fuscella]|uniref:aminodeoxychorismate synthase n=1 Tax=Tothia fuscella TaxID=1048955 RepID=A0A9P4U022_9PEZI|nr:para-aminobenzoate synthase [Tothia fuscella]